MTASAAWQHGIACYDAEKITHRSDRGTPVLLLLALSNVGMMLFSLGVASCKGSHHSVMLVSMSLDLL